MKLQTTKSKSDDESLLQTINPFSRKIFLLKTHKISFWLLFHIYLIHRYDLNHLKKESTALAQHEKNTGHDVDLDGVSIITYENNRCKRK